MKRLISFMVASVLVVCAVAATAFADTKSSVHGIYKDGVITVNNGGDSRIAVLNLYQDGVIVASKTSAVGEGKCAFKISDDEIGLKMVLVYDDGKMYNVTPKKEEMTQTPVASPEPENTQSSESTPKPKRTPYPEVYEKNSDAIHAPAVVTDVTQTMFDDELYYAVSMLHQGREMTAMVRNDVKITSAPSKYITTVNKNADALCVGDVIHFICDLQGNMKNIQLIYRPDFEDYIGTNTSFRTLYGSDGYSDFVFGVPVGSAKMALTVADNSGQITDIDVDKNAFVYVVSNGGRGIGTEIYGQGAKSVSIVNPGKNNVDDVGNIISWSEVLDISYVLVRCVRGTATEIIVFE